MAGVTLGFLKFALGFDTIAFKKGMTEAERDLVKLQKKVEKFGKGMADIGKNMSLAITAPLVGFAAVAVKEAQETATALGKVNNALSQTGAVAGQTTPELKKAAEAFETKSLYEADQVLNQVTATMLRFGKILPENFQAAQQAAVDLAAATGAPLDAAATLVSKALVAPAKAAKALAAIGITLNKAQIKQLETWNATGQAARTQAVVLGLLGSKIKGAALAAQNADPFNQLIDSFKKLAEEVGVILIPVLAQLGAFIGPLADGFANLNPFVKEVVVGFLAVAAAAGPAAFAIGKILEFAAKNPELIKFAKGLFNVGEGSRVAAAGAALMNIGLGPLLIALAALAVAVTAVVVAWDNWDKITAFVMDVYNAVKTWIVDNLGKLWTGLKAALESVVGWFRGLLRAVPFIAGLYKAAKTWVVDNLGRVWNWLKGALDSVVGWFRSMVEKVKSFLAPVANVIGGAFKNAFAAAKASFGGVGEKVAEVKSGLQGSLSAVDLGLDGAVEKTGLKAKEKATKTKDELKALFDELFPEDKAIADYNANLAKLDGWLKAGKISADQYAEAVKRLGDNFRDLPEEPPDWWTSQSQKWGEEPSGALKTLVPDSTATIGDIGDANEKSLAKIGDITKNKTAEMAVYWGDMAKDAVGSMKEMVTAFKSGDILGGIQTLLDAVLKVVMALAKLGTLGTGSQTTAAGASAASAGSRGGFGGARAMGGPVVPGKSYIVGENGPEWFSSKKRGFINPGADAKPTRVIVVPSPYFDTVVDHRAAAVAAPMAGQAAIIGVTGSELRANRRARRNLLAA